MKEILPNEVNALLKGNLPIHIIDVREADEVKAGKIPNAVNIPLGLVEFRMQDLSWSAGQGAEVQLLHSYLRIMDIKC
jgi:rhodanese-related sulfurtransferase